MIKNKYSNKKTVVDGIEFASRKEAQRYYELKLLLRAKKISNLELQKPYELVPVQREEGTLTAKGKIKQGRVIERAVIYVADFVYTDENGKTVVEDTKGFRTKDYIIKRKLMLWVYNLKIVEI